MPTRLTRISVLAVSLLVVAAMVTGCSWLTTFTKGIDLKGSKAMVFQSPG